MKVASSAMTPKVNEEDDLEFERAIINAMEENESKEEISNSNEES